MPEVNSPLQIGVALSGGGIRAAVFHLGVLLRLADDAHLENISLLSSVSGGSLVIAAIFAHSNMVWPSSIGYRSAVYPALKALLTSTDLFSLSALGVRGFLRHNVILLSGRSKILVSLLEKRWNVLGKLAELPDRPCWYINSTCIESGKNWRFSKREMGDWQFGRHYNPPFSIAEAAAASASVPYAIGALKLRLPREGWFRTDPATRRPITKAAPFATTVSLWDGGAYENLGLEVAYKPGEPLRGCNFLVCSDASGPLAPPKGGILQSLVRGQLQSPRLFDIASDQIRALRSRMFVRDLVSGGVAGVLLRMGNSVRDIDAKIGRHRDPVDYDAFLSDEEGRLAGGHPTDLNALPPATFDLIARHGYEVADATLTAHGAGSFGNSRMWPAS